MAFELPLSKQLARAGWKVKIRDKERLEEPHVTIIRGTNAWRIGLRSGEFLDKGRWKDFPHALRELIEGNWDRLHKEWDTMYPHNRVPADEDERNGGEEE